MSLHDEALEYHSKGRKGKIEVVPTKPVATQKDLTLAYSPGVAEPCRMIAESEDLVYEYTAKGNLVAVVTNGTAVLGLGDIGPAASKPVMEGKGVLFKKFADIDVFDIELNAKNPDDVIRACEMLEPTFGGINLEDIKAPECFYIEEQLKKKLKIPVFHDDQHGTAVISGAAFLNAVEVIDKKIDQMKVVFSGGGAAALACAKLYVALGVQKKNIILCDSKGVIYKGRIEGMNPYKEEFAVDTKKRTVAEALDGADAFVGVSVKDAITADMIVKMNKDPIVFAMANPDPEVLPDEVMKLRKDAIMATGRSDYPNQVNNVLGFPFIFRGALDTRSSAINDEMKMAAVKALAGLAKEDVPDNVSRAYGGMKFKFGREYLIPKPFDQRALIWVASAVAEAAMKSGVARRKLDIALYRDSLETLLGASYTVMRGIKRRVTNAQSNTQAGGRDVSRIVFPEGESRKILKAAAQIRDEGIAEPILLGDEREVKERIAELGLTEVLQGVQIIRPSLSPDKEAYARVLSEKRARKGMTIHRAHTLMKQNNYFGSMMVEMGQAEAMLNGISQSYPEVLKPALQVIGVEKGASLAGVYMMLIKGRTLWFSDTTVNIDPTAEEVADIAIQTARYAHRLTGQESRVALLSFSNFGSNSHPSAKKMADALQIVRKKEPTLKIDGEMQADTALVSELSKEAFQFNQVPGNANVLVFPDLGSGNIAYKLLSRVGQADAIGPILLGMKQPVFLLQQGAEIADVVNMASLAAMEVQLRSKNKKESK